MKIFVILAMVALVIAVEGHRGGSKGKKGGKKGGHQSREKTCEQITKKCESSSSARMFHGRHGDQKEQMCASKDGEYATYDKSLCSLTKAVKCDGVKPVHKGKCGECTESNLCPANAQLAGMKKKLKDATSGRKKERLQKYIKKLEKSIAKKLCTVSGGELTKCEFETAKCNAVANGEDLPVKKVACVCDKENVCPFLGEMKEKVKTLSGQRKTKTEKYIAQKQCYCDYKLKVCKAQNEGAAPPPKPDCKETEE